MLANGADVNAADKYGDTALYQAAGWGHDAVVRLLLDHGANVSATNDSGQTAQNIAEGSGYPEIADMLSAAQES
jgi:ankyrin repeat protein